MQTSSHLDWFSVTFPAEFRLAQLEEWCGRFTPLEFGWKGYKRGFRSEMGVTAYSDGSSEQMGTHVIMSGEPLAGIRSRGVTDRQLCAFALSKGGNAARVDMTVNILNSPLKVDHFAAAWRAREVKCPARWDNARETKNLTIEGHTMYVGSETSDRRARIYDKYGEMKVKDPDAFKALKDEIDSWLRVELQTRDAWAEGYQGAIAYNPPEEVIKTAVREYFVWDDPLYVEAITSPDVPIPDIPRKAPAFWRWMDKQVIPAMVKFQLDNIDADVLAAVAVLFEDKFKIEDKRRAERQVQRERGAPCVTVNSR
jgi:hypothetical protein